MTVVNFFTPNRQTIQDITNSNPAVVTTTQPHGYQDTLLVRIVFPQNSNFGMTELTNQIFKITVIDNQSFSIPIDTTYFEPFSTLGERQVPQVIPVAEQGYVFSEAVKNNYNIAPEL